MLSMVGGFQRPLPALEVVLIGLRATIVVRVPALREIADHAETEHYRSVLKEMAEEWRLLAEDADRKGRH